MECRLDAHRFLPALLPALALSLFGPLFTIAQRSTESLPPAAALAWQDPGIGDLQNEISRLEAEVTPWGQVDYSVRLDPVLRFRDYPGESGEWNGRLGISATLGFSDPPDTHARALQGLERARRELMLLRLDAVTDALIAHADLLIAQERESSARLELGEADKELALARRGLAGKAEERGEADPLDEAQREEMPEEMRAQLQRELRSAELEQRMASLDHREASLDLEEAQAEARARGLSATAHYEPLRFELPDVDSVDYRETFEFRMLELELQEAEAKLSLAQRSPLDDLRLAAAYRVPGLQVDVEGGLLNGAPGARAGLDLPGGVQRWQVQLSAQFVLDESWRDLPQLEAEAAGVRADLAEYPQRYRAQLESALVRAALAEETLDLAEEDLVLRGEPARSRLYRAWTAYIRAVARALEVGGASWSEGGSPSPSAPSRR